MHHQLSGPVPLKIISIYIASEYSRYFLLFLSSFVLMTLVGNFFGNLGDVFSDWLSFLEFLQETALLLPLLLELIIPITVLLATIATFSSLNKNAELLAMRGSGISDWRLAFPVLGVSLAVAVFAYLSQNYMYTWMHQTWIKPENAARLLPLWKVGEDQSIYYFGNRQQNGRLSSITSFHWQQNPYQLLGRTSIERGEVQKNSWIFQNVQRHIFQDDSLQLEHVEQWRVETEKLPTVPFDIPTSPHHKPLLDLYEDTLKLQSEGQDVTRHWVAFFQKTAYPFQIFIMVLIGLGLSGSYNRRGMAAESLAISCFLGILFWMLNQITMAVGGAGLILPFFASWSANIFFLALALWLLFHNRV